MVIETIKLDEGEWESIGNFCKVETGELAANIGVMIYSRDAKKAYAGHIHDVDGDDLQTMISKAVAEFGADTAEVYVAGATIDLDDPPHFREYMEQERHKVKAMIQPFRKRYVRWTPAEHSACMELYTWKKGNIYTLTDYSNGAPHIVYRGKIQCAPR